MVTYIGSLNMRKTDKVLQNQDQPGLHSEHQVYKTLSRNSAQQYMCGNFREHQHSPLEESSDMAAHTTCHADGRLCVTGQRNTQITQLLQYRHHQPHPSSSFLSWSILSREAPDKCIMWGLAFEPYVTVLSITRTSVSHHFSFTGQL